MNKQTPSSNDTTGAMPSSSSSKVQIFTDCIIVVHNHLCVPARLASVLLLDAPSSLMYLYGASSPLEVLKSHSIVHVAIFDELISTEIWEYFEDTHDMLIVGDPIMNALANAIRSMNLKN